MQEKENSKWDSIAGFFKKSGSSAGKGLKFLYDSGKEHKHYLIPALNGVMGDYLFETNDKRAIQMNFREKGKDIALEDLNLKEKLKKRNGNIVLFIHGLMVDEVLWEKPFGEKKGYGVLLEEELDYLPLYIRYNSGKHISQNGRSFSDLLENLVLNCGDDLNELIIIAHSMGGLVTRSAGHYAKLENKTWTKKINKIFLIGVPNDGSFLEKLGHVTTFVLNNVWNFHTKLIAKIADKRSNGIKDLRWGFLVDEDWQAEDSDKLMNVKRTNVENIPNVKYYIITGTLSEKEDSIVSQYLGDGLVGRKSANGEFFSSLNSPESENILFKSFTKMDHGSLLTSLEVYNFLKENFKS